MYQHTDALQTDHLNEQSLHSSHLPNCIRASRDEVK